MKASKTENVEKTMVCKVFVTSRCALRASKTENVEKTMVFARFSYRGRQALEQGPPRKVDAGATVGRI